MVLVAFGSMAVETNVAVGNWETAKKSPPFKCPVSRGSSAKSELASITTLLPAPARRSLTTLNSPAKLRNPPLWLRVTLEPMNPIAEVFGPNTKYRASVSGAAAALVSGAAEVSTLAAGTSLAGLEQPANNVSRAIPLTGTIDFKGADCVFMFLLSSILCVKGDRSPPEFSGLWNMGSLKCPEVLSPLCGLCERLRVLCGRNSGSNAEDAEPVATPHGEPFSSSSFSNCRSWG